MDDAPGPASLAALREAIRSGRETPPAPAVARLKSYRWFVVATVCVGAFIGQVQALRQFATEALIIWFGDSKNGHTIG